MQHPTPRKPSVQPSFIKSCFKPQRTTEHKANEQQKMENAVQFRCGLECSVGVGPDNNDATATSVRASAIISTTQHKLDDNVAAARLAKSAR